MGDSDVLLKADLMFFNECNNKGNNLTGAGNSSGTPSWAAGWTVGF